MNIEYHHKNGCTRKLNPIPTLKGGEFLVKRRNLLESEE